MLELGPCLRGHGDRTADLPHLVDESTRDLDGFGLEGAEGACARAFAEELIHLTCEDPRVEEGADRLQPEAGLAHSGIARTLQSKALRRTVESAARRSIAVAARSTSAANVIEYSCMRIRSASTRKSGRISSQGVRSGCVGFLARPAHPTREDRARHAAMRINARPRPS